jgi:hypothetical protein
VTARFSLISGRRAVIYFGCALPRLRFAYFGCALPRLRFAYFGCALPRLRFADRAYRGLIQLIRKLFNGVNRPHVHPLYICGFLHRPEIRYSYRFHGHYHALRKK